jgi:hypothetical protein
MLLNRERALELMQRFSVDALVAATRENIIYMSDFAPWGKRCTNTLNAQTL